MPNAHADAAAAAETDQPLQQWWSKMNAVLQEMGQSHRIVPPVAVPVRWHARRVWKGRVVGEVLDAVAGDLNGNGKSEIVILTSDAVVVLSRSRGLIDVRARADLQSAPASIRPRDSMGSIGLSTNEAGDVVIRVRSSERAQGEMYKYIDGDLVYGGEMDGYPLCSDGVIFAAPGRNYYLGKSGEMRGEKSQMAPKLYSFRCQPGVDPNGYPVTFSSEVSAAGVLRIHCDGDEEYCRGVEQEYPNVGVAHLVADINNDGYPEVITTGLDLSKVGDEISVYSQESHKQRLLYDRNFSGGVVALFAGDLDGRGAVEALSVVRIRGNDRISLWLLN
ncbi:MAG: hypothetical protein JKY56_06265 [Kofleriaceae bacterium]|nr:hypothetical protein [Kofleriaceae bacterium]